MFSYSELSQHSPQGVATVLWLLDSRYFPSGFTSLLWRAATTDGRKISIFQMLPSWLGFPDSSVGKESTCSAGDPGSIPGSGSYTGEGIGYPLQYSQASLVAQLVKNSPAMRETWVGSLGWEDPLEKGKTPAFLDFPCGSAGKEFTCNEGDHGSIPGLGRSPGEGKGYPLQYSNLENSLHCIVH